MKSLINTLREIWESMMGSYLDPIPPRTRRWEILENDYRPPIVRTPCFYSLALDCRPLNETKHIIIHSEGGLGPYESFLIRGSDIPELIEVLEQSYQKLGGKSYLLRKMCPLNQKTKGRNRDKNEYQNF